MSISARLAAVAFLIALNSNAVTPAFAQQTEKEQDKQTESSLTKLVGFEELREAKKLEAEKVKKKDTVKPVAVEHEVEKNETLSSIAKDYDTTWKRIYDKNHNISNPDILKIGIELVIPAEDDKLKPRKLPEIDTKPVAAQQEAQVQPTVSYASQSQSSAAPIAASTSGNTYYSGYCTWYAKNRRADLPNNLGNADTWVARAAAQGYATGSTPRVGAIGQQGMHVVYVESVNSDGTVTVSEMNYNGWNVTSTRTAPASSFQYIY